MTLRAVVIGAGWAGEGHVLALRNAGVDVVALCARNQAAVQTVAQRLHIAEASTEWRRTLLAQAPDIVALATPGALRVEVIELAAEQGMHIFCDKPLGIDAQMADRCLAAVKQAGVKHAYAATHRYDPSMAFMAQLLKSGQIGDLEAVQVFGHLPGNPLAPWGWFSTVAGGGGTLNNGFPHLMAMVERATGLIMTSVVGDARVGITSAPVVPDIHDFRQRGALAPTPAEAADLEWRPCDADTAFTALIRMEGAGGSGRSVSVFMDIDLHASGLRPTDGWYFHGGGGTLMGTGNPLSPEFSFQNGPGSEVIPLERPPEVSSALPQIGDDVVNKWAALAQDFVAHIRGEAHSPYPTFRDGRRYQRAIDAVRSGRGWTQIPP